MHVVVIICQTLGIGTGHLIGGTLLPSLEELLRTADRR